MTTPPPDLPESWDVEDAEVKRPRSRVLMIVIGVVVALVVVGAAAVVMKKDDTKKAWAASVGGPPAGLGDKPATASADAKPGYYLWSDFNGWHLWVVNGDEVAGAKGTITVNEELASAVAATSGEGTVSTKDKTVTFDLPAEPRVVGVDFNPGFYASTLDVSIDGADGPVDPKLVTIGRTESVDDVPFVVEKVPEDQAATS